MSWEFPKIGYPNIVPKNSRILIIRTPKYRKLPVEVVAQLDFPGLGLWVSCLSFQVEGLGFQALGFRVQFSALKV